MTEAKYYGLLKSNTATVAAAFGVTYASQHFGVTPEFAGYHCDKLLVPGLHSGTWGGARNTKFADAEQEVFDVRVL